MKNYKIIGLTGQSGAGKSTAARFFEDGGAVVINADSLVSRLYIPNSPCLKTLSASFGTDIINPDGSLNRPVLAKKAFSSKENTDLLNSLVHPFVISQFLKECKSAADNGAELIIFDAPQLFECKADVICDVVISVTANLQTRIDRICRRDKISTEQAVERLAAQYDEEFFISNSDFVIDNSGEKEHIEAQVKCILSKFL